MTKKERTTLTGSTLDDSKPCPCCGAQLPRAELQDCDCGALLWLAPELDGSWSWSIALSPAEA